MKGPLAGIRVIEMVGLGPCPFAAMMLADMGADVIRIDRKNAHSVYPLHGTKYDITARGRRSIALDLKQPQDHQILMQLVEKADVLIEGFRPGVMERLGLGPDDCLAKNPGLVFGRVTGWGQTGPLAQAAGHDLNYIALSGMLHAMGRPGTPPAPPLNLVGDFGGGAMMLAFGVVCALLERQKSGKGDVIDASMVEGSALLGAMMYGFQAAGAWSNQRGANLLDGGAHFYDSYLCSDGKYISIAAIEPQFYKSFLQLAQITDPSFDEQMNAKSWPSLKLKMAEIFLSKTQQEWCELLEGTDVCFAPVLSMEDAPFHPHNQARKSFIKVDDVTQPAPVPRFNRSSTEVLLSPLVNDQPADAILREWGVYLD